MATPAQIIANKANSQLSTGPVTEAGKAKSSRNRLSHGFASSTRFIPGEDPEQFKALLHDFMREYQPATPTQQILVEKMAHHQWVTLRANRIQDNLLAETKDFGDVLRTLPLMIRYQTTAERAFHKAHSELVKTQKQTGKPQIDFESQKAPEPAEIAPEPPAPDANPPAPPAKQKKPAPPVAPKVRNLADFKTEEEVMEWVKTASPEELWASGF